MAGLTLQVAGSAGSTPRRLLTRIVLSPCTLLYRRSNDRTRFRISTASKPTATSARRNAMDSIDRRTGRTPGPRQARLARPKRSPCSSGARVSRWSRDLDQFFWPAASPQGPLDSPLPHASYQRRIDRPAHRASTNPPSCACPAAGDSGSALHCVVLRALGRRHRGLQRKSSLPMIYIVPRYIAMRSLRFCRFHLHLHLHQYL